MPKTDSGDQGTNGRIAMTKAGMKHYIGTSGYSYKEWKGSFYPKGLPAKGMLGFYADQFRTVEINHTFTKLLDVSVVETWAGSVPGDFRFVLKAPQRITHIRRLKDVDAEVSAFLNLAAVLKQRSGPLLFQLPPNMKKDAPRLAACLALLPRRCRAAFEFRHPSWFDEEILSLLRDHRQALCIADAANDLEVPFVATADWGYLRLRRSDYTDAALKNWIKRVARQKWKAVFVFFKHDDQGNAPQLAWRFMELVG